MSVSKVSRSLPRSNDTKNDYVVDESIQHDEGTIRVTKVSSITTVIVSGELDVYSRHAAFGNRYSQDSHCSRTATMRRLSDT